MLSLTVTVCHKSGQAAHLPRDGWDRLSRDDISTYQSAAWSLRVAC